MCEIISESFKNLDDTEFYDATDAILARHSLVNCIRSDLLNFQCTHQAEKIESKPLIANSLVSPDDKNLSALTAGMAKVKPSRWGKRKKKTDNNTSKRSRTGDSKGSSGGNSKNKEDKVLPAWKICNGRYTFLPDDANPAAVQLSVWTCFGCGATGKYWLRRCPAVIYMVVTKRIRLQKSAQECLKHCSSDNTRLPVKKFTKVVDPKLLEKNKQKHKTKTLREPKLPSSEIFTEEELRHCKDQYDEIQKRKK